MRPQRRRSTSLLATLLAGVILAASAIPAAGPPATAEGAGPFAYAVGRFFTRVGANLVHRRRDYREIVKNRDQALAQVAVDQQIRDYQYDRGWLNGEAYNQQDSETMRCASASLILPNAKSASPSTTTTTPLGVK